MAPRATLGRISSRLKMEVMSARHTRPPPTELAGSVTDLMQTRSGGVSWLIDAVAKALQATATLTQQLGGDEDSDDKAQVCRRGSRGGGIRVLGGRAALDVGRARAVACTKLCSSQHPEYMRSSVLLNGRPPLATQQSAHALADSLPTWRALPAARGRIDAGARRSADHTARRPLLWRCCAPAALHVCGSGAQPRCASATALGSAQAFATGAGGGGAALEVDRSGALACSKRRQWSFSRCCVRSAVAACMSCHGVGMREA